MPNLRKVKGGDRRVIPASTFNTFIDAARDFQARQQDLKRKPSMEAPRSGTILVRNDSGGNRDRFDVLGLGAPLIAPDENETEFAARVAMSGYLPAAGYYGRPAVLLEPLAAGAVGRAQVSGACPARVYARHSHHWYADIKSGDATQLETNIIGSVSILWAEAGETYPETRWALVLLHGCEFAVPGKAAAPRLVRVKNDGGQSGTATTPCTYTYSIYPPDGSMGEGDELATALAPVCRPTINGAYAAAGTGTYGLALFNGLGDPAWALYSAGAERLLTDECEP